MSGYNNGRISSSSWQYRILTTIWLSLLMSRVTGSSQFFPITTSLGIESLGSNSSNNNDTNTNEEDSWAGNTNSTIRCDDAKMRCAYRSGCGLALQHYLTRCASVLQGDINDCPEMCQHALIGLVSSDQGKELMTCDCEKDDIMCMRSKQRTEICRASVTSTMNRTRVSCRVATWICNADALCATALSYYNENCKRMFHGKKCTKRCRNSINILRRQEKAAKLNTCFCDGAEEYDCNAIHRNMDELCYNKPPTQHHNYQEQQLGSGGSSTSGSGMGTGDPRTNKVPVNRASRSSYSTSWRILLFSLVLLLHSVNAEE